MCIIRFFDKLLVLVLLSVGLYGFTGIMTGGGPGTMSLPPVDDTFNVPNSGSDGIDKSNGQFLTNGVSITIGNNSGISYNNFMLFNNVTIAQGATINSAVLRLDAEYTQTGNSVNTTIQAEDADDATAPTSHAEYLALTLTTASVSWNSIGSWYQNNSYDSPDIKTVIQEVVDRGSWASGNDLMLVWKNNGSSTGAYREPASYDSSARTEPQLVVNYTPP